MSEGFFLMHRGWRDNPVFKGEFSRADAWVWLIETACWKPSRVRIKGATIELARGELSFSVRFLAESWGWSKSRVDRFLSDLRDEGMIGTRSKIGTATAHKPGQGQSIITICNYDKYQAPEKLERDNSGTPSGTTAGQQRDKEEQGNKETSIPSPIGDGRASPAPLALDLASTLFRTGLVILKEEGHEEGKARSIIGKWRKTYSDSVVLAVMAKCQIARPANSIEYMTKSLQSEAERAAGKVSYHQDRPGRASVREIGMRLAGERKRIASNGG